jgi:uncharacterized protein with HEPN domain
MPSHDDSWLIDILVAARAVRRFVRRFPDAAALDADEVHRSAVIHQLLIIGEAAKHVSDEFRAVHPEIPLRKMGGMRDVLIHAYQDVDMVLVWRTATTAIPELIARLEPLLPLAGEEPEASE